VILSWLHSEKTRPYHQQKSKF